ncbi:hypothetical protein LL037_19705 [Clostridium estertheticum]|uniref:Uncharacterized protein n=1 Tax=Clostridium estertheticum TaxID=238834 RepID=A0AA47EJ47_9CLOT|nr:hypothetical protein [Clostridium estertheticum]MBU3155112.1 hypothetical protein [Clostridium estertheticum]MBU3198695.1 hypothetical protein [Clostridium estertheticum]MBW9151916.1 hypothetical protein [Clostridium estertheticum]WAG61167.1 hypothetical protein LL038_02655 [Clostridium estertheticum]WAG64668.1 hypothetical protein LL037_19705 [Clostridium estertheticum]
MGLKDKLTNSYTNAYLKRYGDRLTQAQGRVLSVKVEAKNYLRIFYKLTVTILVKADGSKSISKCIYKKHRWFKKISFISVLQGQSVIIQGMKGKKGKEHREHIQIVNIRNMTTKKDLVPQKQGTPPQKVQRVRADKRFK